MHPNVIELVKLITSEIRSNADRVEKWASFKRRHAVTLTKLLMLEGKGVENPGGLLGIDFDDDRRLILLNYTGEAHNNLHDVEGGWTAPLRELRGLILSFDGEIKMVSRGFDKFFNYNELPECSLQTLGAKFGQFKEFPAREKADGHMIEFFIDKGDLCASTRGKFGTASALLAVQNLDAQTFNKISRLYPDFDLMSLVVELVHPDTKVHVRYDEPAMFLLAAFDKQGNPLDLARLQGIAKAFPIFTMPALRMMSLTEMIGEINDRSVLNKEGWVMNFDGYLVKFKYISYIGEMVKSKLSHKYIMNCIKNDRLDKMLLTLEEEIREDAYRMVEEVKAATHRAVLAGTYEPLYNLYDPNLDGSKAYYTQTCRAFWREHVILEGLESARKKYLKSTPPLPFALVG
jgi:hypothetical protein